MGVCRATAKHTGAPCRVQAGQSPVCRFHGGAAPQVRAKARARAELRAVMDRDLTDDERRHPWLILLDAVQRLDVLMREGQFDSPASYVEHVERVVRAAKLCEDARINEKVALARQAQVDELGERMIAEWVEVVDHVLDALPLQPRDREPLRRWALACTEARVAGQPFPPRPLVAALPPVLEAAPPSEPERPAELPSATPDRPNAPVWMNGEAVPENASEDHGDPWMRYLR